VTRGGAAGQVCSDPICREFANASSIDFRMDNPPTEDFKLVAKNKVLLGPRHAAGGRACRPAGLS